MQKRFMIIAGAVFVWGCGSQTPKDDNKSTTNDTTVTEQTPDTTTTPLARFAEGMTEFTNMEWIEYCLPLPLATYPEVYEKESVKGQHTFVHTKNKEFYITVKGMERSDTSVSLKTYFAHTYTGEEEEQGKIITSKNIFDNANGFYAVGYWNNSIHESRFLEITWLRNTEVITLEAIYPIADTAIWTNYLNSFLTVDTRCQ